MNLLKKFVRNDNADLAEDIEEINYVMPDDLKMEMSNEEQAAAMDAPERKEPEIHPATPDKVSLKLLQPRSHTEAPKVADLLKGGCIVLLDISFLEKQQARRLVDFLAGVAYVLGGEMIKTNRNTIVISPAGVDISGFAPAAETAAPSGEAEEAVEEEAETAEEEPAAEEEL